ncbi:rod shape-determining protein MreC [Nonomuraea sp. NPDC050786]|uniref:rod shape-determining protein MreC n=1 Tax=Nonomuraea sp. NPDC050786 TaxID=3154840 RepID=UPI0033E9C995
MRFLHRRARVLVLLVAAAAVLITLDLRGRASVLRSAGAAVTGPAEQALASAARPLSALAGAGEARRRAEELERRNVRLAAELWAERAARTRDAQRADLLATYRAKEAHGADDPRVARNADGATDGHRVGDAHGAKDAHRVGDVHGARDVRRVADGPRDASQARRARLSLVTAQVIAARDDTVAIDAGTRAGVRPGLAVVTSDGLAGRVIEAGPSVATVLLPTAPSAAVGVRATGSDETGGAAGREAGGVAGREAGGVAGRKAGRETGGEAGREAGGAAGREAGGAAGREVGRASGGAIGTVTGRRGDGLLALRLFDADAPLRPGQRVETLGSSGRTPYPPGVPVGTVERVDPARDQLTRTALVRPAVTFGTLDVVGVIIDAG